MTDTHRCANPPGKCRGATLDNAGNRQPAETPNTLCDPCTDAIHWAITDIPATWIALHLAIGDHTRRNTPRVAGSRNPPINLNTDVDALKTDIVEWLTLAAARLSETLNIDDPQPHNHTDREHARMVETCTRIITPHLDTLIDMPADNALIWAPPGATEYPGERQYTDHTGTTHHGLHITEITGLQIAQHLAELRRRARTLLAVTTPRDKLPYPCPGCNQPELSRRQDKPAGRAEIDQIDCSHCGLSWPYDRYQQLCLIWAREDEMERDKLQHQLDTERRRRETAEWLLAESQWRFTLALDCPDITAAEFAATVIAATQHTQDRSS